MSGDRQKKAVEEFFDRDEGWQGGLYESREDHFSLLTERRKEYVLGMLREEIPAGTGRAADVGCGSGVYLPELAAMGFRAVGMDLSEEMARVSRKKGLPVGADVLQGDVERTPFKTGTFSLVISVGVFDYLLDDSGALSEMHRVLDSGGLLLLNVRNVNPITSFPHTVKRTLKDMLEGRWGEQRKKIALQTEWIQKTHGWNYKKYRLRRYEQLVAEHGFSRIRSRTLGFNMTPLRKVGLSFDRAIRIERGIERTLQESGLPFLRYAGMAYIGLFRKI